MKNNASLNKQTKIGELALVGDQTRESLNAVIEELIKIADDQNQKYGHILTLVDVSQLGSFDFRASSAAVTGFSTVSFDRFAIVGAKPTDERLIQGVIGLSGQGDRVKFFDTKPEAERWLLEEA
jgi:hypothetical protein